MRIYDFNKVISSTKILIQKSLQSKFPPLTIFTGEPGVGKSTCAEIVALSLTCKNPTGINPCLVCENCKNGIAHIEGNGVSRNIKKINIAKDKKNIKDIIQEIFHYESGDTTVFIIEEVHTLNDLEQSMLLEEVDKIPEYVHVIMNTTKSNKILKELKDRAISFRFKSLSRSESKLLLDRVVHDNGFNLSDNTKTLILNRASGVPRTITKLAEFCNGTDFTYEQILEFMNEIDYANFTTLMKGTDSAMVFTSRVKMLIDRYDVYTVRDKFLDYILDGCFFLTGTPRTHTKLVANDTDFMRAIGLKGLKTIYNNMSSANIKSANDLEFYMSFVLRDYIVKLLDKQTTTPLAEADKAEDKRNIIIKNSVTENKNDKINKDNISNIIKKAKGI